MIEQFTDQTLTSNFSKELKSGEITWQATDFTTDTTNNFEERYKLETQSLVLSKVVNGKEIKWIKLEKVWDYLKDYSKFEKYVKSEITNLIKE